MSSVPATYRAKKLAVQLNPAAASEVSTLLARQNTAGASESCRNITCGALGAIGLPGDLPADGNLCFFTGVPINGPDIRELTDADAAARLLPLYDGAFTGVFWDAAQDILVIATDCLGLQPLYVRESGDELTLVSETKAIQGQPDLAAWGAFISMGHALGEQTLVNGLRRLPPASLLTYHCKTRKLGIQRYWDWPEPSGPWQRYDFAGALEQDIKAYAELETSSTLLLSGGFDSRLILYLLRHAGLSTNALIVRHDDEWDDMDGRFGELLAKQTHTPYRIASPPSHFYSTHEYLDYLSTSDVGHPSLYLFIAKVASQIDDAAVWDGLMLDFMLKTPHQPGDGSMEAYIKHEVRSRSNMIWKGAEVLFKPEAVAQMHDAFQQQLASLTDRPDDPNPVLSFLMENRARNRISTNPLKAYAERAVPFIPGLSKDFIAHARTIPYHEKKDGRFHRKLLKQLDPASLRLPFVSGGTLRRGGRPTLRYGYEKGRVQLHHWRTQHPSVLGRPPHQRPEASSFIGQHLLNDPDEWLHEDLSNRLNNAGDASQPAWQLLLHWKASRWLHEGTLYDQLGAYARAGRH